MTDAKLGKWLRKELPRLQRKVADNRLEASGTRKIMATEMAQERKLLGALTALVALLGEASQRLDRILDERAALGVARLDDDTFSARLRAVLGGG